MLGSRGMGMGSFTVLSITEALHTIWKGFALPAACDAARLRDEVGGGGRPIGVFVAFAGVAALCVCVGSLIALGYQEGAQNFGDYRFTTSNRFTYNMITSVALEPMPVKTQELKFFVAGALAASLLTFLLYRFSWWPLHPIGFTVAFSWPIRASAFSLFIAWAVKAVALRVGGIGLYRRAQLLFLGFLVGYAAGVALSLGVDFVAFPGQGHEVHSPPM
jgi:hypothetical protein